jgi:hypothetical protein
VTRDEAIYTYGFLEGETVTHADCYLAAFSDVPCGGRMERAHLIRLQTLRRELRKTWAMLELSEEDMQAMLWSPAVWRPACHVHHGLLDQSKALRIPREAIPVETEVFAVKHGVDWWLSRTYGERKEIAA